MKRTLKALSITITLGVMIFSICPSEFPVAENNQMAVVKAQKALTKKQAKKRVIKTLKNSGLYNPNYFLDYAYKEGDYYVFHYYEIVISPGSGSHTATVNWYKVNKHTRMIVPEFP